MRLAYTLGTDRGAVDRLLEAFADRLEAQGVALCGAVQVNADCEPARACDMDLRVLPGGQLLRISQSLGPGARGCRLDPAGLEAAVAAVERGLEAGPSLLIVNKFGKQEAGGRGFRGVIAEALGRGIPVLAGVNALNLPAFLAFADGCAERLAPDLPSLLAWHRSLAPAPAG